MSLETWGTYVLAYGVLCLIPGPSVLLAVAQALSFGRRPAVFCILGDLCGGFLSMCAAFAGVGVILASSTLAFAVLKWAGVAYLAWLGLSQIRAARQSSGEPAPEVTPAKEKRSFRTGFVTGLLNPKAILFFMAFFPQFIDPAAAQLPQFLILVVTSLSTALIVLSFYVLLALRAAHLLRSAPAQKRIGYSSGAMMLGGSILLASSR